MDRNISIHDEYFEWLIGFVSEGGVTEVSSFRKLFFLLHSTPFQALLPMDKNRTEDGKALRFRFGLDLSSNHFYEADEISTVLTDQEGCSILEMMIALALRCEESIMDDASIGDRTSYWFWMMISNLGLNGMTDVRFDESYARSCLGRFLSREYDPDGKGGLIYIPGTKEDLRDVEIWTQLLWYLDTIV